MRNGIPYLVSVAGIGTAYEAYVQVTSDQSAGYIVTLPNAQTYTPGNNELQVFVNGEAQMLGLDYTETSTTSITFAKTVYNNSIIKIRR